MEKTCTKCGEVKPYASFSPHKLGIGGVRSICKPCSVQQVMEYRKTEKGRESARRAARTYRRTPKGAQAHADSQRRSFASDPVKYLWSRAKRRAAQKGVPFAIEPSDIVIPERCPILGIPLRIGVHGFRVHEFGGDEDSMSLDRIVPELGYVPGNVAVISWRANRLKNNATLDELEALLRWLRVAAENVPKCDGVEPVRPMVVRSEPTAQCELFGQDESTEGKDRT